jgi:hypothetical protein
MCGLSVNLTTHGVTFARPAVARSRVSVLAEVLRYEVLAWLYESTVAVMA